MLSKKLVLPVIACLLAVGTLTTNQAYALNDDEAAVLVGLAVGGLTAYAVKHHREHDRHDWEYRERREKRYYDGGDHYYGDDRQEYHRDKHRHNKHCRHHKPRRHSHKVEHYVVHNPPAYGHRKNHHKRHHENGYYPSGYEYEYEYRKKEMRF